MTPQKFEATLKFFDFKRTDSRFINHKYHQIIKINKDRTKATMPQSPFGIYAYKNSIYYPLKQVLKQVSKNAGKPYNEIKKYEDELFEEEAELRKKSTNPKTPVLREPTAKFRGYLDRQNPNGRNGWKKYSPKS